MMFLCPQLRPRPESYHQPLFFNTCLIFVQKLMPTIQKLNSSTVQLSNSLTVGWQQKF